MRQGPGRADGGGQAAQSAQELLNLAARHEAEGRRDQAIAALRQAVSHAPDNATAHYNLGLTCYKAGRLPDAIASLRQAVALQPDFGLAQFRLGAALQHQGHDDEAIDALRAAIALGTRVREAHAKLGDLLWSRDMAAAADSYRRAADDFDFGPGEHGEGADGGGEVRRRRGDAAPRTGAGPGQPGGRRAAGKRAGVPGAARRGRAAVRASGRAGSRVGQRLQQPDACQAIHRGGPPAGHADDGGAADRHAQRNRPHDAGIRTRQGVRRPEGLRGGDRAFRRGQPDRQGGHQLRPGPAGGAGRSADRMLYAGVFRAACRR